MKKSISRIIGVIMLIVAIVFIMFALNHPEKSFPWNNTITWLLYGVYFLVAVVLLIAPKIKKWEIPVCREQQLRQFYNKTATEHLCVKAWMLFFCLFKDKEQESSFWTNCPEVQIKMKEDTWCIAKMVFRG